MKTEEIKQRMESDRRKIIEGFTPEEKELWQMFGEIFADDPKMFLQLVNFKNGKMLAVVEAIQRDTLSRVEDFFTYYPYDCLDAWKVAELIKTEVRKNVIKSRKRRR